MVGAVMKAYAALDYLQEMALSWTIYRLLRRHRIRILHLNNGPIRIGIRAAEWARVPVVAHLRGHGGSAEEVTPLQRRLSASPTVVAAVAISSSVAESVIGHGMPREKVTVIHNPVDLDAFDEAEARRDAIRARWGIPPDAIVAGAFGRVMRYKGQEEFMLAAAPHFERHPELRLMVVGDSSDAPDQDYLAGLQELAEQAPFAGRVVFTGYQHDVAGYYWACDIVVHSSRIREGFGRVVAEGMAAHRPVIAMDEAGPREIVTSGVDGLLVPPRDVDALSGALAMLLDAPGLRESLGRAGRRTVEARFSIPVIAAQLDGFYRTLAASPPAGRTTRPAGA
jgi:glycosyltransferase involved in cell wall biosynthesis